MLVGLLIEANIFGAQCRQPPVIDAVSKTGYRKLAPNGNFHFKQTYGLRPGF